MANLTLLNKCITRECRRQLFLCQEKERGFFALRQTLTAPSMEGVFLRIYQCARPQFQTFDIADFFRSTPHIPIPPVLTLKHD